MELNDQERHENLVEKLTTGFGALLEQVQELARRNTDLEQRLARVREEVLKLPSLQVPFLSYEETSKL
jgi:hypothetical protein